MTEPQRPSCVSSTMPEGHVNEHASMRVCPQLCVLAFRQKDGRSPLHVVFLEVNFI